jgi:murein DD-endopeptidase MepM/ murein hydrolase activator NlpD
LVVFNPFWRFPLDLTLGRMRYVATFDTGDTASFEIAPRAYESKPLTFPLRGEVFVHDGHDLYGHHRRLDITGGMTTHFGIAQNFMRYAHDFVITDRSGRMYETDGARPEDWFGYGAEILAPAAGTVSAARDGMADNVKGGPPPFTQEAIMQDLTLFLGNHVVLAHEDGTYSVLAHMKNGSVRVKPGQRVREGEVVGGMGMSGDAFLVHLHYQHQSGPKFEEGLPAYFRKVRVRNGRGWSKAYDGPVDSGDVVHAPN